MLVMLTNFSQTFFGTSLTTCKHYQKRIALQGVFLDGDSSQLGKGAGHNRVNMLKVLSSERTLCAKHPFVEGLTQWKVKLNNEEKIVNDLLLHVHSFNMYC